MKLLLDTHALLFWWSAPKRLPARVLSLLRDPGNQCLVSAASGWEIATKYRIGKFPEGARIIEQWEERLQEDGFLELPMSARHALKAGSLPGPHRDPFDRMLAAQGQLEFVPVVSSDAAVSDLGAERLWK
ncbi:MAG: type II toxin-antitoxin system VapC family toxin [Spirochaetaceae bacterium]|nr:MAG: type II toxin-antitoxin system VapC family toxin [Spirochaetaceae bacterium]